MQGEQKREMLTNADKRRSGRRSIQVRRFEILYLHLFRDVLMEISVKFDNTPVTLATRSRSSESNLDHGRGGGRDEGGSQNRMSDFELFPSGV